MTEPIPEPANTESKEASYLKDVEVLRRAEAATAAAAAEAAAAIATKEPLVYFSGWEDVTYNAGYTSASGGQLQFAIVGYVWGGQVFLRGGAFRTAGDFTSGSDHLVAQLPASFEGHNVRPLQNHRFANWGKLRRTGSVQIAPNGDISVRVPDNASSEHTSSENIGGISGESPHDHTVDLESPFDWIGLSTTFLNV